MPERHAEFARHGDGRFVSSAPCRHRQSPLLQRIIYLEQFLARLDEQRAQRSSSMAFKCSAAFEVAALRHAWVESEVGHQLFAVTKAMHITDRRDNSVKSDQIDATESGQSQ